MKKKVIIIGSGFGGLAAGVRLAARGHAVEIFEKLEKPGGRARMYEINGFKFDGGPSLVTAPFMVDELFAAAGQKREDFVPFIPVEPMHRFFDADGRSLDASSDSQRFVAAIEERSPADVDGYRRFMATAKQLFDQGFIELADQPFTRLIDLLHAAPDLIRLQTYRSLNSLVSQHFQDDFLRQMFSYPAIQVGGNPDETSSIYALIHHMESQWGVQHPLGGMGALVDALARLFTDLGGEIHTQAEVREILVQKRKAIGVRLTDGSAQYADVIISDVDAATTYRSLIPAPARRKFTNRRLDKLHYGHSLFVIYFGTQRRYTDSRLAHHNILIHGSYKGWIDDLYHRKTLGDDFSFTLQMPSITDASLAPDGCEVFTAVVPVPNLDARLDWSQIGRSFRDRIMLYLEETYLPDLRANIVAEHFVSPQYFGSTLNSAKGAGYSLEPRLTQSTWFRPHNRSEEFDNLYLVGAGTHPGAGLPAVLSSAKIAEHLIQSAA